MEKVFKFSNKSIIFSVILVLVSLTISVSIGAAEISTDEIVEIFLREILGYQSNTEINNINKIIILEWRLPRFCLGFLPSRGQCTLCWEPLVERCPAPFPKG